MSEASAGPTRPPQSPTWPAATALGVAVALAAISGAVWWARSRPTVHTTTVTIRPAAAPVNAADCPVELTCTTSPARRQTEAALRSAFPGARTFDDWRVVGSDERIYTETVRARTADGTDISVTARCVPHGAPVRDHSLWAPAPGGGRLRSVIVAGAPGCSVAVTVSAPRAAGGPAPGSAAVRLAHEPGLQLRP